MMDLNRRHDRLKAVFGNPELGIDMKQFRKRLLRWYGKSKRDLPWRRTQDPYAIWISEIMLQQTQVSAVVPYFRRFLRRFPTVHHLSRADLSRVLAAWEGLGYYSRARHLHRAAKIVCLQFQGNVPDTIEALLSLPGVGRYTAGAILSIAYNKPAPIVDGNIKRVLARLLAIPDVSDPKESEGLWEVSAALIPKGRAATFNQAFMELGALVCTPRRPACTTCPVRELCRANSIGDPEAFPLKRARRALPEVEAVSAVIRSNGAVLLRRRPSEGLLGGLWEFPNWNLQNGGDARRFLARQLRNELKMTGKIEHSIGLFRQTFSHFKLTLQVYECEFVSGHPGGEWVFPGKLAGFPMSRLHRMIADRVLPKKAAALTS
jgi:A/G-specific adenine glycosylase